MNPEVTFLPLDSEYILQLPVAITRTEGILSSRGKYPKFEANVMFGEAYYAVESVDTVGETSVIVTLEAVQVLVDGESPVGCNACDLGDHTLPHKASCPVHDLGELEMNLDGTLDYV
jgi:hypothetical protein